MQDGHGLSEAKRVANEIDQNVPQRTTELATLVDSIPGMVSVLTVEGHFEFINRRVEEYFGKTLTELRDWATSDAIHPEDRQHTIATWKRSLETGGSYDID